MTDTKRIPSYTTHCKVAAQHLFWLLREIEILTERGIDESVLDAGEIVKLAQKRHLWCVEPDPSVDAVEPIVPGMHRQFLREPHPQALPAGSKLRSDPGQLVAE